MGTIRRLAVAALVLAAGLVPAGAASAGPLLDWLGYHHCPKPSYSPFRYWTPTAARAYDDHCGPRLDVHAPDRHPEIEPDYVILRFDCPPAVPSATLIEVPLAPPESRARYILGPR